MAEQNHKIVFRVRVSVKSILTGEESQVQEWDDPGSVQLMQILEANLLDSAQGAVVKDTGGTSRSFSANTSITGINVVAGTDTTAAAVTDYKLNAQSSNGQGSQAGTVGSVNTTTGVFTVTANMSAPSSGSIVYGEVGLQVTTASYTFSIARGTTGGTWSVDTVHYLAVTYTQTPS